VPAAGRTIEVDLEVAERLAGPIGKRSSAVALDRMRQLLAGGLQVTLHAHLELPFRTQPRWIGDRRADGSGRRAGLPRRTDVVAARPVATLAIDSFGQAALIHRLTSRLVVPGGDLRVSVVAEHALVGDGPRRQGVIAVVSRTHRPGAPAFGIPGQGKL